MESSIRTVSIFWKLSWGLENKNALFKKTITFTYIPKPEKRSYTLQKVMTWSYIPYQILSVAHISFLGLKRQVSTPQHFCLASPLCPLTSGGSLRVPRTRGSRSTVQMWKLVNKPTHLTMDTDIC